jgi:hypothetical protein
MTNPKHDLDILFGDAEELPVMDLGIALQTVVVEIASGDTYYLPDWYEARAAIVGHRPRVLPQLSEERPIFWWFQPIPATTKWAVIEFTLAGERQVAQFDKASIAYEYVLSLRNREKKRRRDLFIGPIHRPIPQPPYRCICRAVFDTADELLEHRCGIGYGSRRKWPRTTKESP